MKKILLVLIFSILFSSNAFSSNKFYIFGTDSPGDKDSSLCAFDGNYDSYNRSTSTFTSRHGEYVHGIYPNCEWSLGFLGSVKINISYESIKYYGTTSTAVYKGKATNNVNNHKSSYPDFVLNRTNGVGNEKAPQTIYVFSEKSVVVAERERLKNTPKLAETKIVEEKKLTTSVTSITSGNLFCGNKYDPLNVKWLWLETGDKGCDSIMKLVDGDYYPFEEISTKQYCLHAAKYLISYKDICVEFIAKEKLLEETKRLAKEKKLAEDKRRNEIKKIAEKKRIAELIQAEKEKFEIAKKEFGFQCEWIKWNKKDSPDYNTCINNYSLSESSKQLVTPIIKSEPEVITVINEKVVAKEIEPQLEIIGEAEFGFKCQWMHWNSRGSASYNACIDTYVNAEKVKQEELILAEAEAENQAQQAKLLEDKMNELDRMYGATCKAMGLSKKDDEFPKCMMEMMKIEQEKEQAKIQNEIAMAQIQLQQAQLEAQNKAMDLRLAELENNNELIRQANIRSQKADAERNRQQQVLLKKQIALQEKKNRQDSWANALIGFSMLGQQNTYQAPKTTRCTYTAYGFRCS